MYMYYRAVIHHPVMLRLYIKSDTGYMQVIRISALGYLCMVTASLTYQGCNLT